MPLTNTNCWPVAWGVVLASAVGLSGCSGKSTDTAGPADTASDTQPTTTGSLDTDTGPEIDLTYGALELRYGFDGFDPPVETCADMGTKTLWLDMSFKGAVEPSTELPCDDQPILLVPGEIGTHVLQLATESPLHDGSGLYGESYAIYAETEPDEITDVYVPIVCYQDGVLCQ